MPSASVKPSRKLSSSQTTPFQEAKRRFRYEHTRSHNSLAKEKPLSSAKTQHFENECSSVR